MGFDGAQVVEIASVGELVEIQMRAGSEAIDWRTKFEPMKPAPPVTRMRSSMLDVRCRNPPKQSFGRVTRFRF